MGVRLPIGDDDDLASRALGGPAERLRLEPVQAGRVTHPPGLKPPNDAGLFDVMGNASEWCMSLVDLSRDPNDIRTEGGPPRDHRRSTENCGVDSRGGSFLDPSADIRSANRNIRRPNERLPYFGMRLARTCPR